MFQTHRPPQTQQPASTAQEAVSSENQPWADIVSARRIYRKKTLEPRSERSSREGGDTWLVSAPSGSVLRSLLDRSRTKGAEDSKAWNKSMNQELVTLFSDLAKDETHSKKLSGIFSTEHTATDTIKHFILEEKSGILDALWELEMENGSEDGTEDECGNTAPTLGEMYRASLEQHRPMRVVPSIGRDAEGKHFAELEVSSDEISPLEPTKTHIIRLIVKEKGDQVEEEGPSSGSEVPYEAHVQEETI